MDRLRPISQIGGEQYLQTLIGQTADVVVLGVAKRQLGLRRAASDPVLTMLVSQTLEAESYYPPELLSQLAERCADLSEHYRLAPEDMTQVIEHCRRGLSEEIQ